MISSLRRLQESVSANLCAVIRSSDTVEAQKLQRFHVRVPELGCPTIAITWEYVTVPVRSTAWPLGAYLFQHNAVSADNDSRLLNLQGVRMGRPGRIYISLSSRAGVLEEVRVGGEAVVVGAGTFLD
jgi:predicted PhzF superfamily epimerase YddE/YHI9